MSRDYIQEWKNIDGDNKYIINHPELNEDSIIFELGAYKGKFVRNMFLKYKCNIYVFEPYKNFHESINKLIRDDKIKLYNYGVSNSNCTKTLGISADSSSLYINIGLYKKVILKTFEDILIETGVEEIDLINMNIEGEEYQVLPDMIKSGDIKKVKYLQVQFHKNIDSYRLKRRRVRTSLEKTHEQVYSYPFVWEAWKLKKIKEKK